MCSNPVFFDQLDVREVTCSPRISGGHTEKSVHIADSIDWSHSWSRRRDILQVVSEATTAIVILRTPTRIGHVRRAKWKIPLRPEIDLSGSRIRLAVSDRKIVTDVS